MSLSLSLPLSSPAIPSITSQPTPSDTTSEPPVSSGPTTGPSSQPTTSATSATSAPPSSAPLSTPSSVPPTSSTDTGTPSSLSPTSTSSDPSSAPSLPPTSSGPPPGLSSSATTSASAPVGSSTSTYQSTQPNGSVVYVTTVIQGTASPTGGSVSAQSHDNSKGFFDNKGAVAGVFTVVGLVVLALVVALVTNAIRRGRAKKFDRDVAEAAAEAAAAAHAHPPDFGDDDDYGYPDRSVYTDNSHGTYSQQPMHVGESYNMTQLPPFDPYINSGGAMAGAAGNAGVGAAGLNRSRSTTTPYNAFAGPHVQPPVPPPMPHDPFYDPQPMHDPYGRGPYTAAHHPQAGLLEAAGLAGGTGVATGTALARGPSQYQNASLSRSKSSGARTLGSNSDHQHETYASHYRPGFDAEVHQPQPYPTYSRPVSMAEDPYAGYTTAPSPHSPLQNQFAVARSNSPDSDEGEQYTPYSHHEEGEGRTSLQDEEDYGYNHGRRVLKVANT